MSPKNLALFAGAIAILAVGVYLMVEVKATPAQATPSVTVRARPAPTVQEHTPVATTTQTPAPTHNQAPPAPTAPIRTTHPNLASIERVPPPEDQAVDLKTDNLMEQANKAYDRQDFDEATALASKVLAKEPDNVRMLRVMVSANCIGGDSGIAQTYYEKLPKFDRDQMKQRCDRYGVVFKDPPQ